MSDVLVRLTASGLALLPACLIMLYAVARGRRGIDSEFVWIAVLLGACTFFLALGFELVADLGVQQIANPYVKSLTNALFATAIPEELSKLLPLVFILMRHEECRGPADIMIAAIGIGLGFAALENLFYVVADEDWLRVGWLRASTAVPAHAVAGMILGYFAAESRDGGRGAQWMLAKGLAAAIIFHALYDAPLLVMGELSKMSGDSSAGIFELHVMANLAVFSLVILAGGIIGLFCLNGILDRTEATREESPIGGTGILRRGVLWKTAGCLAVLSEIALVVMYPSLSGGPWWLAIPTMFLPLIFGVSIYRFGRRLGIERNVATQVGAR